MKRKNGTHTFDLYLEYLRCPACGYIIESREAYEDRFDKKIKDLRCSRCEHPFSVEKKQKVQFGPLFN